MSICDSLASTILCTNKYASNSEEHASNVKFPGDWTRNRKYLTA